MLVVLVGTHNAQRKVEVQIVGHRVVGHFPCESNAGTDIREQGQTILQAGVFMEGDEDLEEIKGMLNVCL